MSSTNSEGFDRTNLYRYMDFSRMYSDLFRIDNEGIGIVGTVCQQSDIYKNLIPTRPIGITWSHYRKLLQVESPDARAWYEDEAEMKSLTAPYQDKLEYMKNPVVAEFLMEIGKGFAFVDRQKHIHTEKNDYYIDLVFYNSLLKCFVLIDFLC